MTRDAKRKKPLKCPNCDLTVARPSHLARHLQSHLPVSRREHFSCAECGRQFSRNDVLLRHLRMAHQAYASHKKPSQKSCFRCVAKKLKCDRAQPCSTCARTSNACEYPLPTNQDAWSEKINEGSSLMAHDHIMKDQPSAAMQSSPMEGPPLEQCIAGSSSRIVGARDHEEIGLQCSKIAQSVSATGTSLCQLSQPSMTPLGVVSSPILSYHTTSPQDVHSVFQQTLEPDNVYTDDFNFMHYPSGPRIAGMAEGGVDWLNVDVGISDYSTGTGGPYAPMNFAYGFPSHPQQLIQPISDFMGQEQAHGSPTHGVDYTRKNNSWVNGLVDHSSQQWPFEQGHNPEIRKYTLPPLREILQGTIQTSEPDNAATIRSVVQLLSAPFLSESDLTLDPSMLPATDLLKTSLDLYITEFHSVLPVIHVPTFSITSLPTVTLAAMACIGAMYSDDKHGTHQSWSLSEICIQMINWLGGSDNANFSRSDYLIACCLHQIYSLGSGNRRLYQNADCSRGMLIGCLRGMGVLKHSVSTKIQEDSVDVSGSNAMTEWYRWKDQEQAKRLAWSAFEYDCSLCTLTSRRGAVDLPELPDRLPCAEPLWDAPSALAWVALYGRLSPIARGAATAKTMQNILAGETIAGELPAWSKRLCAQTIGRLLWDLKQLDILSTAEHFRLPTMAAAQRQTKTVLLRGLAAICESMHSLSSTAELIHYNITSLICHYSHLYSADEAMDLVVHIFRTAASRGSAANHSLDSARSRLSAIFLKHPQKARNLAWHAAQIIAVANEYLVSAPCEIMRVFMGYIFILAFIRFGPRPSDTSLTNRNSLRHGQTPVRLDLANRVSGQKTAILSWIDAGGPATIGAVANIYDDGGLTAIAREAQTMLRKMRFWGLARIFMRILEGFDLTND